MEFYKVQSIEEVTNELILSLIERYKEKELPRLRKLQNYYLGKTEIKNRKMNDPQKPNNKVASPICSYLVSIIQGFFLGKPVAYSSDSNNQDYMLKLQEIYDKNHEQSHNSRIGKQLSITGIAYELIYMNENNEIKFSMLSPEETFMIYDNSIEMNPLFAVRFYDVQNYLEDTVETHVEVYSKNKIEFFRVEDESLVLLDEQPHYFQGIPVNVFHNNDENFGDFEKVIDLVDSFDKAISDTANNIEYFADAYLVLSNIDIDEQTINTMKENRVMILNENGSADWLIKDSSNIEIESFKDRLKQDIHTLSCVPDLGSESMGSNVSGEALKYRLFGLETITSVKERLFEKALEQRIKLITNILNIKGGSFDNTDIVMSFQRNLPTNFTVLVDMVSKLQGTVSTGTLLSLLPFIDDPAYELELLANQMQDTLYNFPTETINP